MQGEELEQPARIHPGNLLHRRTVLKGLAGRQPGQHCSYAHRDVDPHSVDNPTPAPSPQK